MEIQFQFEQDKAIQTMAYLVGRLESVDKVKLMKLVYLADKRHFLRAGYPITGDRPCALPYGPIPSATMDVLDGNVWPDPQAAYQFLHVDDNKVTLKCDPGSHLLSADEKATLDEVLGQYAHTDAWQLVNETHELPEYKEAMGIAAARGSKAAPIPYESILKYAGDEDHYRLNRPVLSAATMNHMLCPLNGGADADL
jgi:uncharacterized phage-associated protein